jgi:hypothetical protein
MADARGEKIVMSAPRSRSNLSWLASSVSRISSSLIAGYSGAGVPALYAATCASRHAVWAAGAVV